MDRETQTAIRNRLKPPPSASIAQPRHVANTHTHIQSEGSVHVREELGPKRMCVCRFSVTSPSSVSERESPTSLTLSKQETLTG
jgi:hypothetical protein